MAIQAPVYHPTPSQWASAAMHLNERDEWHTVRISGVRYISMKSGTSGRRHFVRADARGCDCLWSQRAATPCSHRLAVELAATEDELAEEQARIDAAIDEALGTISWDDLRASMPGCAGGCGNVTEGNLYCDDCSATRERSERMAAARAKVLEAWTT